MHLLVSILIPVYNREALIGECIASAQAQTYPNLEIIVCDNASSDRTWQVVNEIAAGDPRVRAFRNDANVGPVRNWQRCAAEARGNYSKILFSDDVLAPNYVERLVPLLEDEETAFAYSGALVAEAMEVRGDYLIDGTIEHLSRDRYFALLVRGGVPFSPGAALFRTRDVLENLRDSLPTAVARDYWRHGAGPDVMLYALTAKRYSRVARVPEALVLFRSHADSITVVNANNEVIEGYRSALSWFFASFPDQRLWQEYLARQWLSDLRRRRQRHSLARLVRDHEGTGAVPELAAIALRASRVVFERILRWS